VIALLAVALLQARAVTGVMTNVQRDWRYEPPCGIIASIMNRCSDVEAFTAELQLPDGTTVPLIFFRTGPGPHPRTGDSGTWELHREVVFPLLLCAQRGALTSTGCLAEVWWALESDDDMPASLRGR